MNDKRAPESSSLDMLFGEALERFAKTDPKEVAIVANASMRDGDIERLIASFEDVAQVDEDGLEFWYARDLQILLDYKKWENFESAIRRALTACEQSGQNINSHWLPEVRKSISGKGKTEEVADFRMTRYACYLTAQNADAKKKPVAFAQTYFAIQTRRQEIADIESSDIAVSVSEDEKRVFLRNQIREHNRILSSAAKDAGVITPKEFAIFHSKGYQGLYGRTVSEIRRHKGLKSSADILDRMGSTELAANFFRVTQTEEKLRKDNIRGVQRAYATHYAVGRQVRDAMLKISGVAPEDLPAVDSIKQAERRLKVESKEFPNVLEKSGPKIDEPRPVNLRQDLWKYALLIMATKDTGKISTSDLISELPNFIQVPDGSQEVLSGRKDSKFSQIVRNLKSHKTAKTNFIYQGFAEAIPDGFRITERGREFVKDYFSQ